MEAFIHTHPEIHFQNHIKLGGTILHYDENGPRICKIKYLTLIQYESKCTRTDPVLAMLSLVGTLHIYLHR